MFTYTSGAYLSPTSFSFTPVWMSYTTYTLNSGTYASHAAHAATMMYTKMLVGISFSR